MLSLSINHTKNKQCRYTRVNKDNQPTASVQAIRASCMEIFTDLDPDSHIQNYKLSTDQYLDPLLGRLVCRELKKTINVLENVDKFEPRGFHIFQWIWQL
jgi:hypothetical protein